MNPEPKPNSDADKEWDDFCKSPMGKALYRNFGETSEEDDDDCSETSFQKFCDFHGNNRYPTQ